MTNSLKDRREQEKLARSEAILDAAEQVFFSKGYDKASMDEIARTANLSRALLYVYFRDKAAMLCAIMLRAGNAMRARFRKARDNQPGGLAQLMAMGEAYYRFSLEQPDYFAVLTQAHGPMPAIAEEQAEQLLAAEGQTMALMCEAIDAGLADGSLDRQRIQQPLQTAYYLRGALHVVIMLCQPQQALPCQSASVAAEPLIIHTMEMLRRSIAAV